MADVCDEALDPRITEELERLNTATDAINSLELQLDEARGVFRQALSESTHNLDATTKSLGSCIEKARPYYLARQKAKELKQETQQAAVRFERANSMLIAAKEMVDLAEQGAMQKGMIFDATWQEMLNHSTMKVNDAEVERTESEAEHFKMSLLYHSAEQDVKRIYKSQRRSINKSKPYFEMKTKFNEQLEELKKKVNNLQNQVACAKTKYSGALQNLEQISNEIHASRRSKLGIRGSGVGQEASPTPTLERSIHGKRFNLQEFILAHSISNESKDDSYLQKPHDHRLKRPFSLPSGRLFSDPHFILRSFESTDHLDNISDTTSYISEAVSEQERMERDSMLSDEMGDDVAKSDSAIGGKGAASECSSQNFLNRSDSGINEVQDDEEGDILEDKTNFSGEEHVAISQIVVAISEVEIVMTEENGDVIADKGTPSHNFVTPLEDIATPQQEEPSSKHDVTPSDGTPSHKGIISSGEDVSCPQQKAAISQVKVVIPFQEAVISKQEDSASQTDVDSPQVEVGTRHTKDIHHQEASAPHEHSSSPITSEGTQTILDAFENEPESFV